MKKRTGIVLLSFLLLTGCGPKPQPETESGAQTETGAQTEPNSETEASAVSMYDLRVAMEGADASLPSMLNASSVEEDAESNFKNISEKLEYEKIDSYFISYSEDGEYADEIVVIAMKDRADVKDALDCLRQHRDNRYKLYEQYQPREVKRVEDGLIFSQEQYAVLIISDNSSAVKKAFEQAINPD